MFGKKRITELEDKLELSNDNSINEDNVEQLVSAIKAGAIIDPRAD
ncbi:hypothetical protein [Teredinibacter purpureus]|nr:hypothetical protein [Teredinibacter purpureus]